MDDKKTATPGAAEATASSARAHNAGADEAVAGGPKRFSAKRKLTAVQRLMRGESLPGRHSLAGPPCHSTRSRCASGAHRRLAL